MKIGYARISTQDQNLNLQYDALQNDGCERIFSDIASGAKSERVGLKEALEYMRDGDILVVWKLDRLGRSLQHLIEIVNKLESHKIGFRSLQENIDTTTNGGKLIFHIFGALAEFERGLIRERTSAGLTAARARGRLGGRPQILDEKKKAIGKSLKADYNNTVDDICKTLNISRSTYYRRFK